MDIESRYEFLEKIGSGSFATVYRARDNELGREVAIKRIHEEYMADTAKLDQFWSEAQLLASLQHPNIVTIYDLYRDRGWLILELMQANLADRMRGRPMDVRAAKTTVAHCLRALKHLHDQGVIHGDVKPSNMMIDARKRIKIGDFGLARRASDEEGSLLKGTTRYMAPEVVSDEFGDIGPASDLYSLGFAAYQLLCGSNFEELFPGLSAFGRNKQVAWMMWHAAPDRRLPEIARVLEGVPEDLAHVVQKLVQKPQSERYKSAQEALDDLNVDQKIVKEAGEPTRPTTGEEDPDRKKRLILLGGGLLVSLCLSVWMLLPSSTDTDLPGEPSVVVFQEHIDGDSIKVTFVDRDGADQIDFNAKPVVVLRELRRETSILLSDLEPGDRIEMKVEGGKRHLLVSRPIRTHGRIVKLEPSNRTITLAPDASGGDDIPLRVPKSARVTKNGEPAGLDKLEEGAVVDVWHLHELGGKPGRVADRIEFTKKEVEIGFVKSVDAGGLALVIETEPGRPAKKLDVADDATITLNNLGDLGRAELADLKPGDRVDVVRDNLVREIKATRDKNRSSGTITALAPSLGTLTVRLASGESRTLLVNGQTAIAIGKTPARMEDLRRTDKVTVTYRKSMDDENTLDASSLTVERPTRSNRWVVLVATAEYGRGVMELPYVIPDARALADVFRQRYGVDAERCIVLVNHSRSRLQRELDDVMSRVGAGSELVVYLGGHAYASSDGTPYFGPSDVDPDRPDVTGMKLEDIVDAMEKSRAGTRLLMLDTSHAGADPAQQPSTQEMGNRVARPNTHILASCSQGEQGRSSETAKQGLFAAALAQGYAGPADTDVDYDRDDSVGISPVEIERFVRSRLSTVAPRQTPVLLEPEG